MDLLTILLILIAIAVIVAFFISGLKLIGDDEVGIVIKKMFGKTMPQGQVVAREGQTGVRADILMPGLYWRVPVIWRIIKHPVVNILPSEVGIVVANPHLLTDNTLPSVHASPSRLKIARFSSWDSS